MPTLTRVYQGRVTKVEVRNAKALDETSQWSLLGFTPEKAARLETEREKLRPRTKQNTPEGNQARQRLAEINRKLNEPWQTALWQHHELFQDAVNYYLSAFAAMVGPNAPPGVREFRQAVIASWEKNAHSNGSLQMHVLGLALSGRPAWRAFEKRIFNMTGSRASAAQRAAAVEAIFLTATELADEMEDAGAALENKLRGKGRSLFPKLKLLCARSTGTTPDNVVLAQERLARRATKRVEQGGRLAWKDVYAFKTNADKRPWTREQAVERVQKAFDDLCAELVDRADEAKKREANRAQANQSAGRYQQGPTAADLEKLHSRFKKEAEEFAKFLASSAFKPPPDEPVRAGSGGYDMKAAMVLACEPNDRVFREVFLFFNRSRLEAPASTTGTETDPVYEARNAGGSECRVFPFFCDLWAGRLDDPSVELGVWADFEKQAFIEVCNKIGQFIITTRRFELRLDKANKKIAETKTLLKHEKRLTKVKELVEELGGARVDANGLPKPYTVRDRTLKAWPKVRQDWRGILKDAAEKVSAEALVAAMNRLQTKFRERFGSAALFDLLAQEQYRIIWNDEDEADPLRTWSGYAEALDEKEHLEKERVFTPAHPKDSPRYFRWSETENKTHWAWEGGDKPFYVTVDALDFKTKRKTTFRISFRAPRLLRDRLRKPQEKLDHNNPDTDWLPPALRPVCEKYGFKVDPQCFERVAVRLAPTSKTNIQLVFEPEIVTDALARHWRARFPFEAYSTKTDDGEWIRRGLKWPKTKEGIHALAKQPVLGLMVDLGINNAAAYHVLQMAVDQQAGSRNGLSHEVGPANNRSRFVVRSIESGLVRVMGEDRWIWREITAKEKSRLQAETQKDASERDGFCRKFSAENPGIDLVEASHAFLPELSGSAGRNAQENPNETVQAVEIFKALQSDINIRIPQWQERLSFPEQNDELLRALKYVRSQLFRLNRWTEQLLTGAPENKQKAALENIRNLKEHDPLYALSKQVGNVGQLRKLLADFAQSRTNLLKEFLPVVANRILPSRRGTWMWHKRSDGWHEMVLDEKQPRPDALLAGQRGLSMARLLQLRDLRQLAQSLNHLCRHHPGERRHVIAERDTVPEPFEGCRQALEDAREDRAKQIAHDILALAVGVKLTAPPPDKKELKESESLHGVYRCLERGPVNFIALEDLSEYGTSGMQARRENRQLAAWSHRRINKILTELCEPIGLRIGSRIDLPIVYVRADLTSRFSAKDHSAGFRAEEISKDDPRRMFWERQVAEDANCGWAEVLRLLDKLSKRETILIPRKGGPVFVSLAGFDPDSPNSGLFHADLNAAYRIGLRAFADRDRRELFGTVMLLAPSKNGESKERQHLIDVAGVLPRSARRPDFRHKVVVRSEGVWDRVDSNLAWEHCDKINRARFRKWRVDLREDARGTKVSPPNEEDNIPM
ncbi:MAG: type V CRISPR-associated protein Cas12b [Verrucomicrobiia bacterium]